jgi:amino acid transporter
MSITAPASERGLVRAIGVRGLTASIVNTTIGAGIFVLPALVARDLGSAAPLAYLACGLAMTFVVASFAMAGSRVSLTAAFYAYVEVAFGPLIGFLTGFLLWLACLLAAASVASALAASVALAVPAFEMPVLRTLGLGIVFATLAVGQCARRCNRHAPGRDRHRGEAACRSCCSQGWGFCG